MAVEAEFGAALAGSESRADVATKDESAGTAAEWRIAEAIRMIEEVRIQLRARDEGDPARREFWADVGRLTCQSFM